jgi:hypothetical protein
VNDTREERSEAEHKELVDTANKGIVAMGKLAKKYRDCTEFSYEDGYKADLTEPEEYDKVRVTIK